MFWFHLAQPGAMSGSLVAGKLGSNTVAFQCPSKLVSEKSVISETREDGDKLSDAGERAG